MKYKVTELKEGDSVEKEKSSNFILTINPNSLDKNAKKLLVYCTRKILENIDKFLVPKGEASDLSDDENIKSVDLTFVLEKAPTNKTYHTHSLIQIKQKQGMYHLNVNLIRKTLEARFGYIPYVNVKGFKSNDVDVINYMLKNL